MITVVDYKAGNLTSVLLAFEALGVAARLTQSPDEITNAERIVFPGVGSAGSAAANLSELGMVPALRAAAARGAPFLGICLGAQIILDFSEEDGGTNCIGLLRGKAAKFKPTNRSCKVPHMGWNSVRFRKPHPVFNGIEDNSEFYFVHSFYPAPAEPDSIVGATEYAGVEFASALGTGNVVATQFHPEKSGRIGLKLLKNFAGWNGTC